MGAAGVGPTAISRQLHFAEAHLIGECVLRLASPRFPTVRWPVTTALRGSARVQALAAAQRPSEIAPSTAGPACRRVFLPAAYSGQDPCQQTL